MTIALDKLTPDQLNRFIHLQSIVAGQKKAAARTLAVRAYYDGDHPVMLTERQKEYLGPLLNPGIDEEDFGFAHNVVKTVVDMVKDRLRLEGFTVNGQDAGSLEKNANDPAAQLAALFWQWWNDWRMDAQQSRLYRRTIRDGLSYVMVDYDAENDRPRATLHSLYDGTTGIVLHRDPEDENRVLFLTRYFYTFDPLKPGETGKERKTVYLHGEIRKYIRNSSLVGSWEPIMDDGDLTWPLPWVDRTGKPLGVAVTEFQDPDGGLVGGIIGLQNALNKSWLDLLAAADTSGFPVVAIEYKEADLIRDDDDDDLEGADEFRIAPGKAIEIFGGNIKRLEGADMDKMINVVWNIVQAVAAVQRLPQYDLRPIQGVDFPSGEALKQAETGLVTKAEERQLVFGQSWADVMALAAQVQDAFGVAPVPQLPKLNIHPVWKDAQTRMEKTEAEVATLHSALRVPDDAVWRKLGYTPEEIARFMEDAMKRRAAEVASIVAATRQPVAQPGQATQQPAVTNGAAA